MEAAKAVAARVVAERTAAAARAGTLQSTKRETSPAAARTAAPVPGRPRRVRPAVAVAALVVMVGALAVLFGDHWLGRDGARTALAGETLPATTAVVQDVALAIPAAVPTAVPAAGEHAGAREPAVARPAPKAAGRSRRESTAAAADRRPGAPAAPVASSAASAAAAPASTADVAPPPVVAPTGHIFDQTDVDEPPRVTARVEPRLPTDVPIDTLDVVVVRLLVSDSGQPFRISVLRGSRLGPTLDEAVIEAVSQWRFAPAQKKGQAVSSWYNVGVPLGQDG